MSILFPLKDIEPKPCQSTGEFAHANFKECAYAVDFECPPGTPVVASDDGKIIYLKDDARSDKAVSPDEYMKAKAKGEEGKLFTDRTNLIAIEHPDRTFTEYIHLAQGSATVKLGDEVKKGQIIATTGLSGIMDAPHLHFNRFKVTEDKNGRMAESIPFKMVYTTKDQVEEVLGDLGYQPEEELVSPAKAVEAVKEAQSFFQSFGLSIDVDGLVTKEPNKEQLAKLKEWHKATTAVGIIMPTEEDFYRKTLLAVSLWRQQEGENINYLLGKGTGVEVALQGNVTSRTKRPIEFSYRSHSDFELYGVDYEDGRPVYTEPFTEIFGGQEYFPPTKTKGLQDIPPSLLHETSEVVDFGGVTVRIPQLELLFLDKYITKESIPRPEGYDHELLARQYVLDRAKIHQYLDQLVIEPLIPSITKEPQKAYQDHLDGIKRLIGRLKQRFQEFGMDTSHRNLVDSLNEQIQSKPLSSTFLDLTWSYPGICLNFWETIEPEQIDPEGNIIDQEFLQRLQNKVKQVETSEIEKYKSQHQEIDQLFDEIEKEFATTTS